MIPILTHLAATALTLQGPAQPTLNSYYETDRQGLRLTAEIAGAPGPAFALLAHADPGLPPCIVQILPLDADGNGMFRAVLDPSVLTALQRRGLELRLSAAYLDGSTLVQTPFSDLVLGSMVTTTALDFDYTIGDDSVMVAGRPIADQWRDIGLTVSAVNSRPSGPDLAILFDSGHPTGGDNDLRTPNPAGFNNNTALGHLLIIAENAIDRNGDGLIDVPDDEARGGSLIFDFDSPAMVTSVTMVDIDEAPGTELRFYRNGNLTTPDETLAIASLGDGSVQTVTFDERGVDRFEVFFQGSGGISDLAIKTCPTQLSLDETSTGVPRSLLAGTWMTDQLVTEHGVQIAATNNTPGHPDKAILFDSLHPTGGDWDLLTPNPSAPGNTEPLGMVLIVAENDVDANGDGLVDDPDDEARGGTLRFEFDRDVTVLSARVLDVDRAEIDHLRCYDANGVELSATLIPNAPDGSVQRVLPNTSGVRTLVLELGGSGAITRIRYCED